MVVLKKRIVYGRILYDFTDERQALAYALLTGRKTVTKEAINSLRELGLEIEVQ